jgi:hypothetical protein
MGRDTYETADEVREVARRVRGERIPCDVVHVDIGWTERKFAADFRFSGERFPDPTGLAAELLHGGFRLSLWQFPYIHPRDPLHADAVERDFVVLPSNGKPPIDDAVIDMTNEAAVRWYREKLERVLREGAATFISDFGEAAPFGGPYRGDSAGFDEHNLYPLRCNRVVAEATAAVTGESVQQARRVGRVAALPAALRRRRRDLGRRDARHGYRWRCAGSASGRTSSAASRTRPSPTSISAGWRSASSAPTRAATARRRASRGGSVPSSWSASGASSRCATG